MPADRPPRPSAERLREIRALLAKGGSIPPGEYLTWREQDSLFDGMNELFIELDALRAENATLAKERDKYFREGAALIPAGVERDALAQRVTALEGALEECVTAYQAADSQRSYNAILAARKLVLAARGGRTEKEET